MEPWCFCSVMAELKGGKLHDKMSFSCAIAARQQDDVIV
jgi:hypothetical protein